MKDILRKISMKLTIGSNLENKDKLNKKIQILQKTLDSALDNIVIETKVGFNEEDLDNPISTEDIIDRMIISQYAKKKVLAISNQLRLSRDKPQVISIYTSNASFGEL